MAGSVTTVGAPRLAPVRRPGRRAERKASVSITVPLGLLDKVDDLVESGKLQSRSEAFRLALERFLEELELPK